MADRVALVTGGAGGIGSAVCADLAAHGYTVVAGDRAGASVPSAVHLVELDIRSAESCTAAIGEVVARFGGLDLLVNSAGINARGATETMPEEVWSNVVEVNLNGTFRMCQAAYAALARSGGGIVNLSSTGALVAIAGSAMYGVTKAAITHLTKILAVEWAGVGIRVNAVAPTIVATAMTADVIGDTEYMAAKMATIPLGRIVTVEEVAAAIRWLASPDAAMVTGQTVPVDGGVSLL